LCLFGAIGCYFQADGDDFETGAALGEFGAIGEDLGSGGGEMVAVVDDFETFGAVDDVFGAVTHVVQFLCDLNERGLKGGAPTRKERIDVVRKGPPGPSGEGEKVKNSCVTQSWDYVGTLFWVVDV
jgi:hypothetical protein